MPFMVEKEDLDDWIARMEMGRTPKMPFPNIGDMDPDGWERVGDSMFVDSTGMSADGEMAAHGCMSVEQMLAAMEPGFGYAIIEVGQFQLHVGKFRKL